MLLQVSGRYRTCSRRLHEYNPCLPEVKSCDGHTTLSQLIVGRYFAIKNPFPGGNCGCQIPNDEINMMDTINHAAAPGLILKNLCKNNTL